MALYIPRCTRSRLDRNFARASTNTSCGKRPITVCWGYRDEPREVRKGGENTKTDKGADMMVWVNGIYKDVDVLRREAGSWYRHHALRAVACRFERVDGFWAYN